MHGEVDRSRIKIGENNVPLSVLNSSCEHKHKYR